MTEFETIFYYMKIAIEVIAILPDWLMESIAPYLPWITFPFI